MTAPRRLGVAGALSALVLLAGILAAALSTAFAYLSDPLGPWDHQAYDHIRLFARIGLVLTGLTAPVALFAVTRAWLSPWWYVPLALIGLAAWGRLTVLLPAG